MSTSGYNNESFEKVKALIISNCILNKVIRISLAYSWENMLHIDQRYSWY